eukprot:TRINITY_DN400_c1_g1_i1.p1 TRINITY_DN400_c1_g1~~TRINITY_DN400_c1_g1_i1.p1  ORF type:complete len:348 (-),score=70.72 TRINITY_DN400_c1_g1_i1:66-1109(-)
MKNSIATLITVVLFITSSFAFTRNCAGIWKPAPGMSWLWQIGTVPSTSEIDASNAQAVDIDMFNAPTSLIDYIHSKGKTVICYIDTQYEPNRPDSKSFPSSALGNGIEGWPGQLWVDVRDQRIWDIAKSRALLAQSKGCDAIEWDDVDGYANNPGFQLTAEDQLNFNKYLAIMTHSLNMSVGLKNDVDQINDLVDYFDWALNEECVAMSECSGYTAFVNQEKAVFGTEYTGTAASFCPTQNAAKYSWLLSNLDLNGKDVTQCCSFLNPPCPKVSSICSPAPSNLVVPTAGPNPTSATVTNTGGGSGSGSGSGSESSNAATEDPSRNSASLSTPILALVAAFLAICIA